MNHLGDTNKMVSDTPRTETYVLNPLPQVVSAEWARQLERELNTANARIKRLKESLDKTSKAACKHIKRLEGEVYALRLYGNRDCTAMADQALKEGKL